MGSVDTKLFLAKQIQLPLIEMKHAVKQAVSLHNQKKTQQFSPYK